MLIIHLKKENQFAFLCKCNGKLFCIRKVSKIFWTLFLYKFVFLLDIRNNKFCFSI
ncbi:Uncharacterised protein [Mycobacteroides abscessus subsp. abscessus]|nr:Uncharacterised protein [Mycobacteroides abscessus subsp. abscessus]